MLLKPTQGVPHEGGFLFDEDSRFYKLFQDWISQGCKFDTVDRVDHIEVFPKAPVLQSPGDQQQVAVIATFPDGKTRDVTRDAVFETSNFDVATVGKTGAIEAVRRGEAAVLVRYEGQYATAPIIVIGTSGRWTASCRTGDTAKCSKCVSKTARSGLAKRLLYYTWGATEDDDVARALGKNAASLMWDDSLGAGLQMALFDAVAKSANVPIYRLLGEKVYDKTPLSWWNIDTSAEDMAAECKLAHSQGYMAYKTKGRPWFDVYEQVEMAAKVVPDSFKIDIDFNDTLRTAEQAIPILKDLAAYPQIDIYETPIPQGDIEGNKKIRAATRVKVAMHYGIPPIEVAIKEDVCDGFIIGGGATTVMEQGGVAAKADKPFWLQLVGTGITAAFSLHFGAVLSHARWPAVNCHQLYTHTLLTEPIVVRDGFAAVPEKPGLGYELDREAVEKFRVEKPAERPDPPRLIKTTWADGRKMYIGNTGKVNFMLDLANAGSIPFYRPGAHTELVPNDGSQRWQSLQNRASKAPIVMIP